MKKDPQSEVVPRTETTTFLHLRDDRLEGLAQTGGEGQRKGRERREGETGWRRERSRVEWRER